MSKILILQAIYRGSYLFALRLFVVFRNLMRRKRRFRGRIFLVAFWGFVWMRRLEPQTIRVREWNVSAGFDSSFALIADVHLGVYKDDDFLRTVVERIQQQGTIDMVLIAGDHTYEPLPTQTLERLFAPLLELDIPVFAVLGNHDVEQPGPDLRDELVRALERSGVIFLNNNIVELPGFSLIGLGAHLNGEDDVSIIRNANPDKPTVVLTHNPDTTLLYGGYVQSDVTLVGHTHCGQIRIPYLYEYMLPVEGDFDCGWYMMPETNLFITPGLGEVVLPLRFLNPPTIDILHFTQ